MLYMKDWEVCAPPGFSLGFEGDNGATVLEVSTDLTEEWDLKVDVEKDGEKNIIELGKEVEKHFGEKANPLYERLAKYFQILDSYHFVEWK